MGTKTGDVPIEQPIKFHLVIQPGLAKRLSLTSRRRAQSRTVSVLSRPENPGVGGSIPSLPTN
jgi:hypothetical protein